MDQIKNDINKNEKHHLDLEYSAIRSEILTWITIEYTLIAVTASVSAISLSMVKVSPYWIYYSCCLIIIVSCLGFLTSHARSKIMLAAAYIAVFHPGKTFWEHYVYKKLRKKWTIATMGKILPLIVFYMVLLALLISYPAVVNKDLHSLVLIEKWKYLILPILIYLCMLITLYKSYHRESYEKIWNALNENNHE